MNREILFRGKRVDNDEWVYGDLVHNGFDGTSRTFPIGIAPNGCYSIEAYPDTVGQFTGLKDKNGKEIYEGDIIAISSRGFDFDCQVTYDKQLIPVGEKSKGWEHMLYSPYWEECVIIGNIHEQKTK